MALMVEEDEYIIPPLTGEPSLFPNPRLASDEGLLAYGGDLSSQRLIEAYKKGIFPWFSKGDPILWWSPNPRLLLLPHKFKVRKSFRRVLRSGKPSPSFRAAPSSASSATWRRSNRCGGWAPTRSITSTSRPARRSPTPRSRPWTRRRRPPERLQSVPGLTVRLHGRARRGIIRAGLSLRRCAPCRSRSRRSASTAMSASPSARTRRSSRASRSTRSIRRAVPSASAISNNRNVWRYAR